MKRLMALAPAVLLSAAAFAQEAPEAARMDLRCGLIFLRLAVDVPPDAPAADREIADLYVRGGNMLVERAAAASRQAGLDEEGVLAQRAAVEQEIVEFAPFTTQMGPQSFEDCSLLLKQVIP